MIGPLVRVSLLNLRRDRPVQILVFVVPIVFFSIFASIFGGRAGDRGGTPRVRVAVVDEARTARSAALLAALQADSTLRVTTEAPPAGAGRGAASRPLDRARAEALVRAGTVPAALVLPAGLDTSLSRFDGGGRALPLLVDPSDRMAGPMVTGLLQRATLRMLDDEVRALLPPGAPARRPMSERLPARTEVIEVVGDTRDNGMIAFYAAGIAVMFLLFSATGAAGALLDETDSGTLERVLGTRVTMTGLLGAKWAFITGLGVLQIVVMFVWGMLVFRLDLLPHVAGFLLVTVATAGVGAAFALVLATACRTRAQLQGVSTLVVLSLSAVGGSMFPRFLMPEWMQRFSLVGFNAWALEAYLDVFWRDVPLPGLLPRVGVLVAFTVLFLFVARRLARRWEVA
jgi:ABC-2 type transport system permease protein